MNRDIQNGGNLNEGGSMIYDQYGGSLSEIYHTFDHNYREASHQLSINSKEVAENRDYKKIVEFMEEAYSYGDVGLVENFISNLEESGEMDGRTIKYESANCDKETVASLMKELHEYVNTLIVRAKALGGDEEYESRKKIFVEVTDLLDEFETTLRKIINLMQTSLSLFVVKK